MADETSNLSTLLKKIAAENDYSNPDIEIMPISTGGANYSSKLYLIKIKSHGKEDLRLFAKIAAMFEKMREQTMMQPYANEQFAYSELLKVYRELERKNNISKENMLAIPKFYGADASPLQELLVLEDLACQGYLLHHRAEPVSWEYAEAAFTELAKFHALSFAFQHNEPSRFQEVSRMFRNGMLTEHEENLLFYNSSMKTALKSVRAENKEKLQRFIEGTNLAGYNKAYEALETPVIIHADFRPSNMLHRVGDDGCMEVVTVDYQTIQAGSPILDILYFIFLATDGPFRAKYYRRLIDHYHNELGAALARLGLDVETVYSRKNFEWELKEKLPFGLHLSVMVLAPLLMAEAAAPAVGGDFSMAALVDTPVGDTYIQRLNEVIDDYVAWGILV